MNKKLSFLIGLILFPIILFAFAGDADLEKAAAAARERKGDLTIDLTTQAIAEGLSPQNQAMALILRASQEQKKFILDKALKDYNDALEKNIDLQDNVKASGYGARGQLYVLKGLYNEADRDINKSIKLNSKDGYMYCIRGSYYSGRGNLNKSMEDYNKATELLPNKPEPYYFRGGLFEKQGKYQEANADYQNAIDKHELTGGAKAGLIGVLYMQGKLDETLKAASEIKSGAEELSASKIRVYFTKLQTLNELGRKNEVKALVKEAEKYIKEQIQLEPQRSINYAGLGLIYCEAGVNIFEAIELGDKANQTGPESCGDHIKALCYFSLGDYDNAIRYMLKHIDKEPMDLWSMYKLGLIYRAVDKEKQAQSIWDRVLKVNPKYRLILKELMPS